VRPTRDTLTRLATALEAALAGSAIDRVWRPAPAMLLLDVRRLGKVRLLVDVDARHPRVIATTRWPDTPAAPDRETIGFRKLLEGQRIARVAARGERQLALEGADGAWSLVVQLAGRYPNVAVFDADGGELMRLFADRPGADPESPALPPGAVQGDESGAADLDWLAAYAALTWDDWDTRHLAERRAGLEREIRSARERLGRTLRALERELTEAAAAARRRHQGELLKTVLRTSMKLRRPMSSAAPNPATEVHKW
jgi:predicted ribosome quality control (RQC) complex YloA/Tae2 family protein